MENFDRPEDEYIDDLWAFFQNCWHLKDWVKADLTISRDVEGRLEEVLKNYESLMICADLANRTKHHSLDRPRLDAMLTDQTTNLVLGRNSYRVESRTYVIELADGTKRDAHTLARQAVTDWHAVFDFFGIRRGAA